MAANKEGKQGEQAKTPTPADAPPLTPAQQFAEAQRIATENAQGAGMLPPPQQQMSDVEKLIAEGQQGHEVQAPMRAGGNLFVVNGRLKDANGIDRGPAPQKQRKPQPKRSRSTMREVGEVRGGKIFAHDPTAVDTEAQELSRF